MKAGRNDPCPCGSGKKYKQCCARADAAAEPALRILGRESRTENDEMIARAIARPTAWEADVVPMPMSIDGEPDARPVAIILAANDVILSADLEPKPPADAEGVANMLSIAIRKALAHGGAPPNLVRVAHPEVATHLRRLLKDLGVAQVVAKAVLPVIEEFAGGMRQHLTGSAITLPAVSHPIAWAAWKLPAELLTAVFSNAATYYSRAPWTALTDSDVLELTIPGGQRWFACVLGNAGQEYGLVLYELLEDYLALATAEDEMRAFASSRGIVISLSFDKRSTLPKPMRKEIETARWPIAGPSAYPSMWTLNTIGGGLPEEHARDLIVALDIVSHFADPQALRAVLNATRESWTFEPSGVTVQFAMPEPPPLWHLPLRLAPCLPQGARADATAYSGYEHVSDADPSEDKKRLEHFALYNRTRQNEARALRDLQNASLFVGVMELATGCSSARYLGV